MIVLDILLFCNLVLFAVCAIRSPRAKGTRIDDLVARAELSPVAPAPRPVAVAVPHDNVLPFPGAAELARRRAKAAHPSTGLRRHPSRLG